MPSYIDAEGTPERDPAFPAKYIHVVDVLPGNRGRCVWSHTHVPDLCIGGARVGLKPSEVAGARVGCEYVTVIASRASRRILKLKRAVVATAELVHEAIKNDRNETNAGRRTFCHPLGRAALPADEELGRGHVEPSGINRKVRVCGIGPAVEPPHGRPTGINPSDEDATTSALQGATADGESGCRKAPLYMSKGEKNSRVQR